MAKARKGPRKSRTRPQRPSAEPTPGPGKNRPRLRGITARRALLALGVLALVALASIPAKTFFFSRPGTLSITYPFDGAVFPPEIIPPTVWWTDAESDATRWHIRVDFGDGGDPFDADVDTTYWVPGDELWESMKARTLGSAARITVSSRVGFAGIGRTLSTRSITISTSADSVGAPIYYRDVPLPFISAVENVSDIKWRLGNVGSHDTPEVVLSDLPVCGNCHSFSADGAMLGMDVDVANDKGAYVLTSFDPETVFSRDKIFSWYSYFGSGKRDPTFGLLARVSPDGRYVVGGMGDRAVFLTRSDLGYSQIFFPVIGSLAYFDRNGRTISMLQGADDDRYVQANPAWTPDGQRITFARSTVPTLTTTPREPNVALTLEESAEVLGGPQYLDQSGEGYTKFLYDLYTIPFNEGRGGVPVPLEGASGNGRSNYFPKYSPDGKWLVFTQAESFMLLMPDSRLYIMPAEGGEPRLMNCNTESMNSWHSWSPNSKWLVFSSKVFSPYTQLFLTHIDENGNDTPPVLLKNFVLPERAANIPEFVNIAPDSKRSIEERFVDDYNYLRQGRSLEIFGRVTAAQSQYQEALRLNPNNTEARLALGLSYANRGQLDEAEAEFQRIPEGDPRYDRALYCLGGVNAQRGDFGAAVTAYRRSLAVGDDDPGFEANIHVNLGRALLSLEDYEEATAELRAGLALDPQNVDAHIHLGNIAIRRGDLEGAILEFERALELDPSLDTLGDKIEELKARIGG